MDGQCVVWLTPSNRTSLPQISLHQLQHSVRFSVESALSVSMVICYYDYPKTNNGGQGRVLSQLLFLL
jgi:hypothetical protein